MINNVKSCGAKCFICNNPMMQVQTFRQGKFSSISIGLPTGIDVLPEKNIMIMQISKHRLHKLDLEIGVINFRNQCNQSALGG